MIDRQPRRSPNGLPLIATQGVEVDNLDVPYMEMAAAELNFAAGMSTEPGMYWIVPTSASEVQAKELRSSPEKYVIRVAGLWAMDPENDLTEFVDRVEQIKADFSGL